MATQRFKRGTRVIKLPLEEEINACVIKVVKSDGTFAYCCDGNKYSQSTGRRSGRCVLNKKDIIKLPPFGYSAEEEAERLRNIAIRNQEIAMEEEQFTETKKLEEKAELRQTSLEVFEEHKRAWQRAKKIRTPLGDVRLLTISHSGKFYGDTVQRVILVMIKRKALEYASGIKKQGYVALGSMMVGIQCDLHKDTIVRSYSIEGEGTTIQEAVGSLISMARTLD